MCADTVQEPAVVADDHGAAGKGFQTLFQGAQGVDVDVVGRLVEQEHVALFLERHGQMQSVALTARKHAAQLVLVGTIEVEAAEVGVDVDIASAHAHQVGSTAHHFVDRLLGVDVFVLLIDVGQLDGFAFLEGAAVGLLQAHDEAE